MKNLFLLLAFAFVCVVSLNAQSFPLLADNPRWEVSYTEGHDGPFVENYYLGQAVTFEDKEWIEVFYNRFFEQTGSIDVDTTLAGYYRVEGMQVYFRKDYGSDQAIEGLLYDFSLNEGDTAVCVAPFSIFDGTNPYHVLEVDTIHCGEKSYRRLHVVTRLETPYAISEHNTYWIEGFGDMKHPFANLLCLDYYCGTVFISNTLYLPTVHVDGHAEMPCPVVTPVSDLAQELSLSLFPNPISTANQELFISGLKQQQTYEISLINLIGQRISHWDTTPSSNPLAINLPELTTGMYWLHIRDQNFNIETLPLVIE